MSDISTTPDVLDPDRPWITDERQLPSRMSWIASLFNPTGKSPKLHFTRVWTVCFFLQFLIVVIPFGLGIVIGLAGGNPSGIKTLGLYASPVVFIATTLISYVAHSRRLNDAGKLSLWAVLVLIPLLIGMALFMSGVMQKSAEYDGLYDQRAEFLDDPQTWRAERLVERQAAQAKQTEFRDFNSQAGPFLTEIYLGKNAAMRDTPQVWRTEKLAEFAELQTKAKALTEKPEGEEGASGPESQAQRGGQRGGNGGVRADQELPDQVAFILKPNVGIIQMILFGMNLFIMIWSLTWVARVPDFGKSKPKQDDPFVPAGQAMGAFD